MGFEINSQLNSPASRSLLSVELTDARKRDFCPGLKWTVLSIRHGYLATKPLCDACYYAGSQNDSGVTVNKCTRDSGLKLQSVNSAGSMHFVSVVHDYGWWLNQSPLMDTGQVSFPRARQYSEYNGKEASARREQHNRS